MTAPLNICVVGCGTGGPAAALYLRAAGHNVQVIDRVATVEPVGAGFLLQPIGLGVLAELGVLREVLARGAPVHRLYSYTRAGRTILDLWYSELMPSLHGLGVHRAMLLATLIDAMRAAHVDLHLGTEVLSLREDERGVHITTDQGGQGPFDLVVIANGARSSLRDQLSSHVRVRKYTWGAMWHIGPSPQDARHDCLEQIVDGSQSMLGLLPTGTHQGDTRLTSLFWSLRIDRAQELRERGLSDWKAQVLALCPHAGPIVEGIRSFDDMAFAEYLDVRMKPWHRGKVVAIGDAAHAMSPQLGQGANLALCDARALATSLAAQPDVEKALQIYTNSRRHHLRFYQWASRVLTPFFQSSSPLWGWTRDIAFPLANLLPPVRRQGIRTMAGVKRGLLRSSLPLPTARLPWG